MAAFSESVVEDAALAWLESIGYVVLQGRTSRQASPARSAAIRT